MLIKKHRNKIKELSFDFPIMKGFFILVSGECELEDDKGWNGYMLS